MADSIGESDFAAQWRRRANLMSEAPCATFWQSLPPARHCRDLRYEVRLCFGNDLHYFWGHHETVVI